MDDKERMAEDEAAQGKGVRNLGSGITYELRAWNTGRLRPDQALELDAIAGRIDERYAKTCKLLDSAWTATAHEVALEAAKDLDHEYVRLPVDAEEAPILKRDKMIDDEGYRFTADWFEYMGGDEWAVHDAEGNWYRPEECRHRELDVWEKLLDDAHATNELAYAARCRRLAHEDE